MRAKTEQPGEDAILCGAEISSLAFRHIPSNTGCGVFTTDAKDFSSTDKVGLLQNEVLELGSKVVSPGVVVPRLEAAMTTV